MGKPENEMHSYNSFTMNEHKHNTFEAIPSTEVSEVKLVSHNLLERLEFICIYL
jgi:hypothetical protein